VLKPFIYQLVKSFNRRFCRQGTVDNSLEVARPGSAAKPILVLHMLCFPDVFRDLRR
jgi:hypothetical protein